MATDGPTPPPCNKNIFENGDIVASLSGSSNAVENLVKTLAKKAKAKLDWHYAGGIAMVKFLGDKKARNRVESALDEIEPFIVPAKSGIDFPNPYLLQRYRPE